MSLYGLHSQSNVSLKWGFKVQKSSLINKWLAGSREVDGKLCFSERTKSVEEEIKIKTQVQSQSTW